MKRNKTEVIVKKREMTDYDNPNKLMIHAHEPTSILDDNSVEDGDKVYEVYRR